MLAHRTMLGTQKKISYNVGSYTFTVPTGATSVKVTLVGGGGCGGNGSGSPNFYLGGGGGAGGAIQASRSVTAGDTLGIVVGAGGTNFFGGQDSTVTHNASGDVATAEGGNEGLATVGTTAGAGGAGGGFSSTGSWSPILTQTGASGSTGQPSGSGAGGTFVTFYGISGTARGSGSSGEPGPSYGGSAGLSGIVIVEWS